MNIDFLHNQIIRDTITQRFIESFNENLVPYLISEYGSSLAEVQLYEDHLASGFRIDGEFHYPLTLVCDGRSFTRWIKWPVANYRNYDKFNPFTYKGAELLEFELLDDVSDTLKAAIAGRPIYADASAMPVVVASTVGDKTFLAGKYSQGFVDALASAITDAVEREFDITGLAESGVVLEIRFMPGTFMEHVVENSTYRRILIKARGCAPRDLWIKWTRLDGRGTYTISDYAATDEIIFEIADEVPGKIREKEYRYLAAESVEKYQTAMSRKNMTEWREMMRRVIRRGEVEKCETEPKLAITAPADELEETPEIIPEVVQTAPVVEAPETDALKALLASLDEEASEPEEIEEEDDDLSDLLKTAIGITTATAAYTPDDEEEEEIEEEPEEDIEDEEDIEEEIPEIDDTPVRVVSDTVSEDKIRLEMEKKIRAELEEELRRKHQEAEELRARLEAQLRAEMREKELMAEAARAAIQEQQRLAKEREAQEALAREEEARRAAEAERAREEARIANERAAEEARIKAELEAKERARQEAEAAAEAAKAAQDVKYVSKVAKLIFKSAVDPSITKRIHEIILATIKYYHKEDVYIKIKATIPDSNSINLEFVKIPESEISLLVNIIKVLGRSDLGITRATLD